MQKILSLYGRRLCSKFIVIINSLHHKEFKLLECPNFCVQQSSVLPDYFELCPSQLLSLQEQALKFFLHFSPVCFTAAAGKYCWNSFFDSRLQTAPLTMHTFHKCIHFFLSYFLSSICHYSIDCFTSIKNVKCLSGFKSVSQFVKEYPTRKCKAMSNYKQVQCVI